MVEDSDYSDNEGEEDEFEGSEDDENNN